MAANKVGAKRSLFKKPAWASTSTNTDDDDAPIFGQSHHYSEILEKERLLREKNAARQLEKAEKQRQQEQEQQFKRRRISKDVEDSENDSGGESRSARSASVSSQRSQRSVTPVEEEEEEEYKEQRNTPRKQRQRLIDKLDSVRSPQTRSKKAQPKPKYEAIVLDDEDEEDEAPAQIGKEDDDMYGPPKSRPKKKQAHTPLEEESEEEDEYLRELKAKAREQARTNKPGIAVESEHTIGSYVGTNSHSAVEADSTSPDNRRDTHTLRAASTPAGDDEAEVKIWIKTIIPGAKEVIVNRKISQPLDKVKEFWIKRNEIEPPIAEKVFFTWNGTRLYNSTTMRGIIERLKKTHPTSNGSDPSNGRITIEAVTDEIFEYRQKQRARKLAEVEAGASSMGDTVSNDQTDTQNNNDTEAGEDGSTALQAQKAPGIVIKLKAQGMEEMSLRVRPNTTIGKILNGFCRVRNVDADMQKWLSYDGDKLDDDATVEEVGFEHEDTVEVYLR